MVKLQSFLKIKNKKYRTNLSFEEVSSRYLASLFNLWLSGQAIVLYKTDTCKLMLVRKLFLLWYYKVTNIKGKFKFESLSNGLKRLKPFPWSLNSLGLSQLYYYWCMAEKTKVSSKEPFTFLVFQISVSGQSVKPGLGNLRAPRAHLKNFAGAQICFVKKKIN